jgi:hypothetical protein
MKHTICLLESRTDDAIGAYLTTESVRRYEPGFHVHLNCVSPAGASEKLRNDPMVEFDINAPEGVESWNCKPHTMIPLLEKNGGRVTWFDSDLILTGPVSPVFEALSDETIVTGVECTNAPTTQGCTPRAQGWGFPIGREIPQTLNSSVLSCTVKHLPLLRRWKEILSSDTYRTLQRTPLTERPIHAWSDQDVLCALLASKEFSDIPLRTLKLGSEMIHVGHSLSYNGRERLMNIGHLPPFVHAGAARPWSKHFFAEGGAQGLLRRVNRDLSPYTALGQQYAESYPQVRQWRAEETFIGKLLRFCTFNNMALSGLPLWTAAFSIRSVTSKLRNRRS